ncbi:glycosyltransferase family 4 protein [Olleya sp. R77988]|uniref:glycosyltransferase family 4 protein n=1 Tax=Olleya sp. R77988 TaxID=3093875 RepID=UPI0037C66555
MKTILYIGNKLVGKGKTATTIDTLGKGLEEEGFIVNYSSSYQNKVFRLIDMMWSVFKYRKITDFVLIDTYSTVNFYYAYAVSKLCYFFKLKYIPILHGGNLPERLKSSPKLSASIFKKAYLNVSPSGYIKSEFETLGYSNIKVIPNSISINNYPFSPRKPEVIKMLWVRSFSTLYNPNLAIDILFQLKQKGVDATLCMVGPDNDGSLQTAKNYAKQLGIDVKFTGKLTKTEWIKLSKTFTVFINTTNFDNTPVSVIEAMALGLPIVSTNVGGLPFLINNGVDGCLVNANQTEGFVDAILKLKNDNELSVLMSKSARNKAESFDWQIVKKQWTTTLV